MIPEEFIHSFLLVTYGDEIKIYGLNTTERHLTFLKVSEMCITIDINFEIFLKILKIIISLPTN